MKKTFNRFRKVAFTEGVSFLLLSGFIMPLKYIAHIPIGVTITGGVYGVLFISFMVMAFLVKEEYDKNASWVVKSFLASIFPFGTFVMDVKWKKEVAALAVK